MKYIFQLLLVSGLLFSFYSCDKPEPISCEDGIMNQNEEGVDCGGNCAPCNNGFPCDDGILNGTEIGVDCGGECLPCFPAQSLCFDGVQNGGEQGIDCGGPCTLPCNLCTPSSPTNQFYGYSYIIDYCDYNSNSGLYEIEAGPGFGYPRLEIKINSANPTLPSPGTYEVRYGAPYEGTISIRVDYNFGNTLSAVQEQEIFITENNPMTIIICDIEFDGVFNITTSAKIECD